MTSLAEVLAVHQWRGEILGCDCRWNWPETRTYFCGEEERVTKAHIAHQAEAIAAAGLAVVELPEPTWHKDATEDENAASSWEYPDGEVVVYDDGFFEWRSFGINDDDASRLRDAAAALIAAANAAEAGTS